MTDTRTAALAALLSVLAVLAVLLGIAPTAHADTTSTVTAIGAAVTASAATVWDTANAHCSTTVPSWGPVIVDGQTLTPADLNADGLVDCGSDLELGA